MYASTPGLVEPMSEKLNTLDDIKHKNKWLGELMTKSVQQVYPEFGTDWTLEYPIDSVSVLVLRAEAVKWAKILDGWNITKPLFHEHECIRAWIIHFFNLTEDDLK